MKVLYGGTGRQGQRKPQPRTTVVQGLPLPQSPPVCLPQALVCLWCPAAGWGALWPRGVPKARAQLLAWERATVSWSALGLACLKTSSWVFPAFCTGQLCQLWAFLFKMLLISAAELHGGKHSLKTAHVCRRESLKGGEKRTRLRLCLDSPPRFIHLLFSTGLACVALASSIIPSPQTTERFPVC